MKKLTLRSLLLSNFKGRTFAFHPNGQNATIYGDNATGKSTLYDALCWLLFGKDSQFKSNFEIKNLDSHGQPVHNLEHTVEGEFLTGEELPGTRIVLRKVFSEKWTKKRGSTSPEMTGHNTDYYVNGVPKKEKEYQQFISEIATEDQFKLLTSPFYFPQVMKWQDRRSLLMSFCKEIHDTTIIAADSSLAPLGKVLGFRSIDDHKKVISSERKKLNDQLAAIPARIDEIKISIQQSQGINQLLEIDKINKLSDELEKITAAITDLRDGGGAAELRRQIAESETDLINAENARAKATKEASDLQAATIRQYEESLAAQKKYLRTKENDAFALQELACRLDKEIAGLREEWDFVVEAQKAFTPESNCPTCLQPMPYEAIAEARANHNEQCATRKAEINAEGKAKSQQLADTLKALETLSIEINEARVEESELAGIIEAEKSKQITPDPEAEKAVTAAKERIKSLRAKDGQTDTEAIQQAEQRAETLRQQIKESQSRIAIVEAAQQHQDRKKELEKEQKDLAGKLEALDAELFLIDKFTRAKVEALEEQINGMFSLARFKMFEEQINGEVAPCCKVTFNGIPFETSLNSGARIQVGMDCIKTISRITGLSLPVFVDNNESVTQLPEMECQVIGMFVSETDKTLRVEVQE